MGILLVTEVWLAYGGSSSLKSPRGFRFRNSFRQFPPSNHGRMAAQWGRQRRSRLMQQGQKAWANVGIQIWQLVNGLVSRQNTKIWTAIRKIQGRLRRDSQVPRPSRPRPYAEPRAEPEPSTGESYELTPVQPDPVQLDSSESKQESPKS